MKVKIAKYDYVPIWKLINSLLSLTLFFYATFVAFRNMFNGNDFGFALFVMILSYFIFDRVRNYNIKTLFQRFYERTYKIIRWLPFLWKHYDFDYMYAIDAFKFQLNNIAKSLESENAFGCRSKEKAKRIRTVIALMDKVYDEYYAMEYMDEFNKKHPKYITFIDSDGYFKHKYDGVTDSIKEKELDEIYGEMFLESQKKQEKAHDLLWKLIAHNIRGWWD